MCVDCNFGCLVAFKYSPLCANIETDTRIECERQ